MKLLIHLLLLMILTTNVYSQGEFRLLVDSDSAIFNKAGKTNSSFIDKSAQEHSNLWFVGETDDGLSLTFKVTFKHELEIKECAGKDLMGTFSGERVGSARTIWLVNGKSTDAHVFEITGNYKNLKKPAEIYWLFQDGDFVEVKIEDFNSGVISGKLNLRLTRAGTQIQKKLKGTFTLPITGCS
ncbi:MAG: hypothetical protein RJQ09_15540 [Cyclobacteriaceae bacterium]